jgi:hypothetical protein
VVFAPTQTYTHPDLLPYFEAQPGEWYAVLELDEGWALTRWENDPLDVIEWIPLPDGVQLTTA